MSGVDSTITLKDGLNNDVLMKVRTFDDGSNAFYHVFDTRLPPAVDRSGSIAAANTSQVVASANVNRTALTFQNTSDTEMYLAENGLSASLTNGYKVGAGITAKIDTNMAVTVFCIIAGKTFVASEMIQS